MEKPSYEVPKIGVITFDAGNALSVSAGGGAIEGGDVEWP